MARYTQPAKERTEAKLPKKEVVDEGKNPGRCEQCRWRAMWPSQISWSHKHQSWLCLRCHLDGFK